MTCAVKAASEDYPAGAALLDQASWAERSASKGEGNDDTMNNKVRQMMKDLYESNEELADEVVERKAPRKMDASRIIEAVAKMERESPHETEETEKMKWKNMYSDVEFYDDVNGGNQLDKEGRWLCASLSWTSSGRWKSTSARAQVDHREMGRHEQG